MYRYLFSFIIQASVQTDILFFRPVFLKLQVLVLQVAIVRPILFFAAAILWANGTYISGAVRLSSEHAEHD